jgi:hypothetical protein
MFRLSTRRSLWAPSLIIIGASVGIAAMLGISAGLRTWPIWVLVFVAVLAIVAWLDKRLHPEPTPTEPASVEPDRRRSRLPAGNGKPYDLERDRSTDKQRYLM